MVPTLCVQCTCICVFNYIIKSHVTFSIKLLSSTQGVSVEAVDPVFQAKMLDMLKQTGRPEMVVGWYHSHPGFGCWLSGVDINTQQSFEALSTRAVAVVVDPIQSVKGELLTTCTCMCTCIHVYCMYMYITELVDYKYCRDSPDSPIHVHIICTILKVD